MERVEPDYPFPFKIKPLEKESVLDEPVAYLTVAIGVVGIIIPIFRILSKFDPWAKKYWVSNELDFYLHSVIILIIITALIANKQWGYYYRTEDNEGKKGIFKGKVKQVNPRERDLDILLALMGSLLFAFAGLPVYWFFALFLYSIAVVARCYFTLKRKKYAQILTKGTPQNNLVNLYINPP